MTIIKIWQELLSIDTINHHPLRDKVKKRNSKNGSNFMGDKIEILTLFSRHFESMHFIKWNERTSAWILKRLLMRQTSS